MPRTRTLLVGMACVLSVAGFLGRADLSDPDEGRHAEIAREMRAAGAWLSPTLNGQPYYDKPAPYYWVLAASMSAFGENAFAARLPSAVAGLWTLLVTACWARRVYGARAAAWATTGLATTLFFVAISRHVLVDMSFTALLTSAFAWLGLWLHDSGQRRRSLVPFYLAIGLATLAKGPVALALATVLCVWLAMRDPEVTVRDLATPRGIMTLLAIILPFYVAAWIHDPDYIETFLWRHNVMRFTHQVRKHYQEPWYYYLVALPLALLPWLPVVAASLASRTRRRVRTRADWFCLSWAAAVVLLFLCARTRLITYMLPAFPPLACLGAAYAVALADCEPPPRWLRPYALAWIGMLLAATVGYAAALAWSYPATRYILSLSAACALPLALLLAYARRARVNGLFFVIAAGSLVVVTWLYGPGSDVRNALASMRIAASIVRQELPADAEVIAYGCPANTLAFYALRRIVVSHDPSAVRAALDRDTPVALLTKPRLLAALALDPPLRGETIRWRADDSGAMPVFRVLVFNRAAAASVNTPNDVVH